MRVTNTKTLLMHASSSEQLYSAAAAQLDTLDCTTSDASMHTFTSSVSNGPPDDSSYLRTQMLTATTQMSIVPQAPQAQVKTLIHLLTGSKLQLSCSMMTTVILAGLVPGSDTSNTKTMTRLGRSEDRILPLNTLSS